MLALISHQTIAVMPTPTAGSGVLHALVLTIPML